MDAVYSCETNVIPLLSEIPILEGGLDLGDRHRWVYISGTHGPGTG